jgi:uncharacterized protein (DUF1810 family)
MNRAWELDRFVRAQEAVYEQALRELRAGKKEGHWMWFIFPQLQGLGSSATARFYAIASTGEARAYLDHPILGPRLRQCVRVLLEIEDLTASEILGFPDALKLRSCLTLFAAVAEDDRIFQDGLARYFGGETDPATLRHIG